VNARFASLWENVTKEERTVRQNEEGGAEWGVHVIARVPGVGWAWERSRASGDHETRAYPTPQPQLAPMDDASVEERQYRFPEVRS
jgi:hypothetical protein